MNGGVSLSVWIGGVSHEINRVVRGEGVYGDLLKLTETRARVDVISGSSAGGLNGAFLAMAQVHDKDLSGLHSLWINKGDFSKLMRNPAKGTPPSLLRGDDYFLAELRRAIGELFDDDPAKQKSVSERPIDLMMTGTSLAGRPTTQADDFGSRVHDVDHRILFRFRRGPDVKPGPEDDPFVKKGIADRLALAARSTASFPGAFEPSYCPATEASTRVPNRPDRPNLSGFAEGLDQDAFVVDGGVLMNKPLHPALDAIFEQRADRSVRRVLVYVVPDPGAPPDIKPADPLKPPTAAEVVLASLVNLPRVESISDELKRIRNHNRRTMELRRSRLMLTNQLAPERIEGLAAQLFPIYRERRTQSALRYAIGEINDALVSDKDRVAGTGEANRFQNGLGYASRAEDLVERLSRRDLPFIPKAEWPEAIKTCLGPAPWSWGARPIEHACDVLIDVLRRAQMELDPAEAPRGITDLWKHAFDTVGEIRLLRKQERRVWKAVAKDARALLADLSDTNGANVERALDKWITRAIDRWSKNEIELRHSYGWLGGADRDRNPEPGKINIRECAPILARAIAHILKRLAQQLQDQSGGIWAASTPKAARDGQESQSSCDLELRRHLAFFVPKPDASLSEIVGRLLTFHVVHTAFRARGNDPDQTVELLQVSGDQASPFGGESRASRKLAGVQLGHFGAFYKASWRANDWMFGRLDGAERMARALMNPERLRRLGKNPDEVVSALESMTKDYIEKNAPSCEFLSRRWSRAKDAVQAELAFLGREGGVAPEFLVASTRFVTEILHIHILCEELPCVASTLAEERAAYPKHEGPGADFLKRYQSLFPDVLPPWKKKEDDKNLSILLSSTQPSPEQASALFGEYRVGSERLDGEVGGDRFTETVSKAVAITVATAKGDSGLGVLRALFNTIWLPILFFYAFTRDLSRRSRTTLAVNVGLLAISTTLLAAKYLMGADLPGVLTTFAVAAFLGGVLLAVIRNGKWVAVGIGAAIVIAFLLYKEIIPGSLLGEAQSWIALVVIVIFLVVALVSFRKP